MKKFNEKWERLFMAAAFAEAGEFTAAREMIAEKKREQDRDIQKPRKTARVSASRV